MCASNNEIEVIDIDENHVSQVVKNFIRSLKNVDWHERYDRYKVSCRLHGFVSKWKGNFSDLPVIFQIEKIEYILAEVMDYNPSTDGKRLSDNEWKVQFIMVIAESGFKDKPRLDKDGKPILRRTTPLHRLLKYQHLDPSRVSHEIFKIYNRYDLNYTDETGLTHFHVACKHGHFDVVEKFLDLGQDPNCVWTETGDSPLHLALQEWNKNVSLMLLSRGADPKLINKNGQTTLHAILQKHIYYDEDDDAVRIFLETCEANHHLVPIDVRDKFGNTPLHLALGKGMIIIRPKTIESLLRRGADPNSADAEGSTSLHLLSKRNLQNKDVFARPYFTINDELNQTLQVDAKDKLGRTPLQWAVANIFLEMVEILLDRGADMSSFVFPTEDYFGKVIINYNRFFHVSNLLVIVECLEKRGYQLERSEALLIMKHFARWRYFEKSADFEKCWRDDEELIRYEERFKLIGPSLSLGDLIQLRPEEVQEQIRCTGYFQFLPGWVDYTVPGACVVHLCEITWRRFFRRQAIYPFWELIHYRLPLEMCEMIIDGLMNQDLYNICLAATVENNKKDSKENVVTIEQCNTKRPVRVKKYPKKLCKCP